MAYVKSAYMPGLQALPGLQNHQIAEMQAGGAAPGQHFAEQQAQPQIIAHAAASIPDSDCVTAVEGREVNGRQVGNGTYDAKLAGTSARSVHYQAFYHY